MDAENYEHVPPEISRLEAENNLIKIQGLTKTYPNGH